MNEIQELMIEWGVTLAIAFGIGVAVGRYLL